MALVPNTNLVASILSTPFTKTINKINEKIIDVIHIVRFLLYKNKEARLCFYNLVKQQAALGPTKRTTIEIIPKRNYFGYKKNSEKLKGFFYIKNVGKINFKLIAIRPDCDCIVTDYNPKNILPNDSIKISYEINVKNKQGLISNSIVAIGNCQFGNQTFYLEGIIIHQ